MRQSKAKAIRRGVWENGLNPGSVAYFPYNIPQFHKVTQGPTGEPVQPFYVKVAKGTPRVMKDCGRSLYKALKAIR